jgi:hypothetical protein
MAKKIIEEFSLFDEIEDEDDEYEDEEETDVDDIECDHHPFVEDEYNNLEPEKYYFQVQDDDGCNYIIVTPVDYYEEHQIMYDGTLEVDSLPENYVEFMDCHFDEDSGLTKEEIVEQLTKLGFTEFPYTEINTLMEECEESPYLSSTDEEADDLNNIGAPQNNDD